MIFVKKIQSQEWGYRRGIPNKGGKYLLIPTNCWDFFPELSSGMRNSFSTIRVILPNKVQVGLFYVWNNTFNFPEVGLLRGHNERRLYSSKLMQENLSLDSDVLICLVRRDDSNSEYFGISIQPDALEYQKLLALLGNQSAKIFDSDQIKDESPILMDNIRNLIASADSVQDNNRSIDNIQEFIEQNKKKLTSYLGERISIDGDPLEALSSTFRTQSDFSDAVRKIYNGKCALRESFIYKDHPVGLEAAHIHAKTNGGNNLPSNGILLSTDLHRAFDEGIWTLSDELRVLVHDKIQDGVMINFRNKQLALPAENSAFRPYLGYVQWHREKRFGLFTRLNSE